MRTSQHAGTQLVISVWNESECKHYKLFQDKVCVGQREGCVVCMCMCVVCVCGVWCGEMCAVCVHTCMHASSSGIRPR